MLNLIKKVSYSKALEMSNTDVNTLIDALRCSVKPYAERTMGCDGCPYRSLEPVSEELPVPPDVVIDGVPYWESCNVDAMALDAANALEGARGMINDVVEVQDGQR